MPTRVDLKSRSRASRSRAQTLLYPLSALCTAPRAGALHRTRFYLPLLAPSFPPPILSPTLPRVRTRRRGISNGGNARGARRGGADGNAKKRGVGWIARRAALVQLYVNRMRIRIRNKDGSPVRFDIPFAAYVPRPFRPSSTSSSSSGRPLRAVAGTSDELWMPRLRRVDTA